MEEFKDETLQKFIQNHSQIICYGAGEYASRILSFLESLKKNIECFVVTAKNEDNVFLGYPLYEVSEAEKWSISDAGIIVAVSEEFHEAIRNTLKDKWNGDIYPTNTVCQVFHKFCFCHQ